MILVKVYAGLAQQPKLMLPVGHTKAIVQATFSPDGKTVATGSQDKTVKIWNVSTGKLLANLKGHRGEIKSLFFNAQGDRILTTAILDSVAKLWDAKTGLLIKDLSTGSSYLEFGFFSPDGKRIMLSTSGGVPVLFDAIDGLPASILKKASRYIESAAFSPDSKNLVTAGSGRNPEIFDTETGELLLSLKGHAGYLELVKYTPDGNLIISSSGDNTIKVWDAKTGVMRYDLVGHLSAAISLNVSPDGKKLASYALSDQSAKLWNLETGILIAELGGNYLGLNSVSFSQDSKTVLTTGAETKIWDANTGILKGSGTSYSNLAKFNSHANQYIINWNESGESTVQIKDGTTGKHLATLEKAETLKFAFYSDDGKKLVGNGSHSNIASVWDTRTGKLISELQGFTEHVDYAYISPTSNYIITEAYQKVAFWNIENNLLSPLLKPINEDVELMKYSPDGRFMVQQKKSTRKVSLWNTENMECINPDLKTREMQSISANDAGSFVFSDDSKKLFLLNESWESYIMDAKTGIMLKRIPHEHVWFSMVNSSATRFIGYSGKDVVINNIETGKEVNHFKLDLVPVEPLVYVDDTHFLAFDMEKISLYEESNKKPIFTMPTGKVKFNSDKSKVLIQNYEAIRVWDLKTGKLNFKLQYGIEEVIHDAIWSEDEKYVYCAMQNKIVSVAIGSGEIQKEMIGSSSVSLLNGRKGKYLYGISKEKVSIYDAVSLALVAQLNGHDNAVTSIIDLPQEGRVLTISEDNSAKVWELMTGKLLYTCLMLDRAYSFCIIPSGYYMANPSASKILYYINKDLKVISFQQLDIKYNRPDKVLEAIGCPDTALIYSYRKAYKKRIKKSGMDTTSFSNGYSVPEADFVNRDEIYYDLIDEKLLLHINGMDTTYKLDRFNVWVNEVPVFGLKGVNFRKDNKNKIDTTITIILSQGENHIETSITNSNGTESYRMPLMVKYNPVKEEKEMVHFIGIGIDKFYDSRKNLHYSVKDIRDLSFKLKNIFGDNITIDTLLNENVTVKNVFALKQKLLKTNVNDKVIVSFSGHGLINKEYDYFLSTYAVNFQKPEENGLPYDVLESLLDSIPSRKKLMLIDACHSGEVDKEEFYSSNKIADSMGLSKGGTLINFDSDPHLGLKNSFELMQSLFVNVGKNTGSIIISAAAGNEYALESGKWKNGVFTYCILDAMEKNPMKISELKKVLSERVEQLTNGLQKPTYRNETINVDWEVW